MSSDAEDMSPPPVGEDIPEEQKIPKATPDTSKIINFSGPEQTQLQPKLQVIFRPVVATETEYLDLFKQHNFPQITSISLRAHTGLVRFSTPQEMEMFIKTFSGLEFKDQKIRIGDSKPQANSTKTLFLSGLNPSEVSERDIYDLLSPHGFVRRVTIRRDYAFIEFDTTNDAEIALNKTKNMLLKGQPFHLNYARNEQKNEIPNLRINLREILPDSHPFWAGLHQRLYGY